MRIVASLVDELSRKRAIAFRLALRGMIGPRMVWPRDAKQDFYGLAAGGIPPGEQGLSAAELWPGSVFFMETYHPTRN